MFDTPLIYSREEKRQDSIVVVPCTHFDWLLFGNSMSLYLDPCPAIVNRLLSTSSV